MSRWSHENPEGNYDSHVEDMREAADLRRKELRESGYDYPANVDREPSDPYDHDDFGGSFDGREVFSDADPGL